jgi:hypothetical protein
MNEELKKWRAFYGTVLCELETYEPYKGKITLPEGKKRQQIFKIHDIGEGVAVTGLKVGDRIMAQNVTACESLGLYFVRVIVQTQDGKWMSANNVTGVLKSGTEGVEEIVERGKADHGVRVDGLTLKAPNSELPT